MSTTDDSLSERIAQLSDEKRALLEARMAEAKKGKKVGIPKCEPMDAYPLSFAQERLWFLSQSAPENPYYNEAGAAKLVGKLDIDALQRSIQEIVRRHEILRTTIVDRGGTPQQSVMPDPQITIKQVVIEQYTGEAQICQTQQLMRSEVQQVFDLGKDVLMRAMLIRLAQEQHILLIALHHIAADDWSIRILMRELGMLYGAFFIGNPSPLPVLPIQYSDYAVWQRDWLQGEHLKQQLNYWRQQLAGVPAVLELPADRPRPSLQSYRGTHHHFSITPTVTKRLRTLNRREGTTLFMTLLSVFGLLLSRYTGERDFCVGTSIANRNRREIEGLIGFFVNTLVLRNDLSGNPTFKALLGCVKKTCLNAQTHQDLPFEKLVEALSPVRDASYNPLFQVKFDFQNKSEKTLTLPGIELSEIEVDLGGSKFDLTLSIREADDSLSAYFEYSTDLFDESTIVRMAGHFQRLLESVVSFPDSRLSELTLLTHPERDQLLHDWNATEVNYPQGWCIHELFEVQAARNPSAMAVVFEDQQLTYAQLNAKANQLARVLRVLGVGPEVSVGICVERSLEMVIGILGILKAGSAYVPIDPKGSQARLMSVLENTAPSLVLTQERLQGLLPPDVARFCLDSEWDKAAAEITDNVTSGVTPQNLAYVLHTSGSTGKPKGVAVSHRNVVNATQARLDYYQQPVDGFLWLSAMTFDSSIAGLFGTLSQGGRLVLPQDDAILDVKYLLQLITDHAVTHLLTVPSLYKALLGQIAPHQANSLKVAIVAGEACHPDLVDMHDRVMPQVELFNEYGPTEATVWCSVYQIQPRETQRTIPIGRPIANTQIYLLDDDLNPVPVGVTGELYIGGMGITRGYLNSPGLTADRFVPDPYGRRPGARLYRTGDLARYRTDGNIDYIGRGDHQVKIRGFRIELGEVEAALLQLGQVKEAVAMVREDSPQNPQLVAYLTGKDKALDIEAIRAQLKTRLPDYMIPAAFVRLDGLPLTEHGKVDRNALPTPDLNDQLTNEYVAPRNPTEAKLAEIWAKVLGVEKVGVHDNFFELGGHSLLAIEMLELMRQQEMDGDVQTLFVKPTLGEFAAELSVEVQAIEIPENLIPPECERITPDMLPLIELKQEEIDSIAAHAPGGMKNIQDIYPLAPSQEGILFHHLMDHESDPYLYSVSVAFDTRERLESFVNTLQLIINRHDILRTGVLWKELSEPVQVVYRQAILSIQEVSIDADVENAVQQLQNKIELQHYRLDVHEAPLLHGYFARDVYQKRWVLLILYHHLILDHTGFDLLIDEIQIHLSGRLEQLQESYPFRNMVAQSCSVHQSETHETYFRKLLGDVTEPTVPFGLSDARGNGLDIAESSVDIEARLARRIRASARALGINAASLFHLAWARVLAQISAKPDVVFGTVLFGRMQGGDGTNQTIGMFLNTLPVHFLTNTVSVEDGARQMYQLLTELMQYEHVSFASVQRCSAVPAPVPLFLALLNYRHSKKALGNSVIDKGVLWQGIEGISARERTNYPITLSIDDFGEDFCLTAHVQAPIDPHRIFQYMQTVLVGIVDALEAKPTKAICSIDVLPVNERDKILLDWNATEADYPQDKCIHELFEVQVEQKPDAVAVVFQGQQMTYNQLNVKTNQLAHYLRAQGVGPETLVGICVERSLGMVIGILGILKAGGAYVPIDPNYPQERIAFMLEDAQPVLTLADTATRDILPEAIPIIDIDAQWKAIAQYSEDNPSHTAQAKNLAYMIYTSGSTGRPKGAGLVHQGVVNRLEWMQRQYQLDASDCILQKTPFSFDVSVWEFFWPLLAGTRLVMIPPGAHRDGLHLAQIVQDEAVTVMHFVPSMLSAFLDAPDISACRSLRHVICSGEVLPVSLQKKFFEKLPAQLHNLYGPTEASIDVTMWRCEQDSEDTTVPIGRPIANTQIYLLDAFLNPVPIGVTGELYIGGVGLARGYQSRNALTAEKFIPNPFSEQPGTRLYRTGDLARYRADGNIEYIGRTDYQVKIRGFRIELGEIEAALLQHEGVKEAIAIVREDNPDDKRLVAYLVGSEQAPNIESIRAHLKTCLPDYMIPVAFVCLDSLPLSANGKIDRKILPAPDASDQFTYEYVAPRNPTEEILAGIWAEVLSVEKVGIHDNFFELGGHSLLVVSLIKLIREHLGRDVPLIGVFQAPTVAQYSMWFADWVHQSKQLLVCLRKGVRELPLYCLYSGAGDLRGYNNLIKAMDPSLAVYGVQWVVQQNHEKSDNLITLLAKRYAQALRENSAGPYMLLGWSLGGLIAYKVAEELENSGQSVCFLGIIDSFLPSTRSEKGFELSVFEKLLYDSGNIESFQKLNPQDFMILEKATAGLSYEEGLFHVAKWGREQGYWLRDVSEEYMRLFMSLMCHNAAINHSFQFGKLKSNIHVWWTNESRKMSQDRPMEWSQATTGKIYESVIDSDHFGIVKDQRLHHEVGKAINKTINNYRAYPLSQ